MGREITMEKELVTYADHDSLDHLMVEEEKYLYVQEQFNELASNMMKSAHEEFIRTDEEYKEMMASMDVFEDKFQLILSRLTTEEQNQLLSYMQLKSDATSACYEHLYIAGFKDSVQFLKELKII